MECNGFYGNGYSMRLFRKIIGLNESGCFSPLALEVAFNLLENAGLVDKSDRLENSIDDEAGKSSNRKEFVGSSLASANGIVDSINGTVSSTVGNVDSTVGVVDKKCYGYDQSEFGSISESIRISNKLFVSKECSLTDLKNNETNNAIQIAPFGQNSEITRQEINCWAFKSSNYKLKTLLPPFIITEETEAVIINFLNFHSGWRKKFDVCTIKKCLFHSSPNVATMVDMMSMNNVKLLYAQNEDCQVLGIPYITKTVVCFVILPRDRYGLPWLVRYYENAKLMKLFGSTNLTDMEVDIPIFRLESIVNFGKDFMISAFGKKKIINENTKPNRCFVIHHSLFELTTEGTNEVVHISSNINQQTSSLQCSQFYAHHSFMFAVVDVEKDAILFLGQYCGNNCNSYNENDNIYD